MSKSLEKLLSNASSALNGVKPVLGKTILLQAGQLAIPLLNLLSRTNGFYAFESALHVFPSQSCGNEIGLNEWNSPELWRGEYGEMIGKCVFFAEDLFGMQFCIKQDNIFTFDPETAAFEFVAEDFEGWAKAIEDDSSFLTGFPLAHEWQKLNGKLPVNKRLLPKIPFVAGGEFSLENMYLGDVVAGMKFRADLATQIKDLPNGAHIRFSAVE